MTSPILVTGGTGTLGRLVARRLCKAGRGGECGDELRRRHARGRDDEGPTGR